MKITAGRKIAYVVVHNQRQGWALFGVMGILWLVGVIITSSFKDSR